MRSPAEPLARRLDRLRPGHAPAAAGPSWSGPATQAEAPADRQGLPEAIRARLSIPLAERLARLSRGPGRRPATAGPAAPPACRGTAGATAAAGLPPPACGSAVDADRLAGLLGARSLGGGALRLEHSLPLPLAYGHAPISGPGCLLAPQLEAIGLHGLTDAGALCFIDTETSGLAGGTGTVAFIVGTARIGARALHLTQWILASPSAERTLLEDLLRDVLHSACGALVSYNGRAFDAPLLATRAALHGLADPFGGRAHADILHWLRRLPREGCPDLRLASVERHCLGAQRTDDQPGSAAPQAWRNWLSRGATAELQGVLRHNRLDLIGLAALCAWVGHRAAGLFGSAPHRPQRISVLPRCYSEF